MKFLLSAILLLCSTVFVHANEYSFGIVPQQSPIKLFKSWKPIEKYLSNATGLKIVLKIEKSIPEFERILYNGGYDFAYMNPFHYTVASKSQSYEAVVRANKMIKGILVMKKGAGSFNSLVTDKNTTFLFPAPNAFAATLLIKYELLTEFGVNLNQNQNYKYVNSHDSVYKGVARNVGQLGSGIQRTFKSFKSGPDKEKLGKVYETKAYPSHPFAIKSDIPSEDREKVVKALLSIPDNLINRLNIKKIIPSNNAEFDVIRELASKLDTKKEIN